MTKAIETIDLSFYDNPKTRTGFPGIKSGAIINSKFLTEFKVGHKYRIKQDITVEDWVEINFINKLKLAIQQRCAELGVEYPEDWFGGFEDNNAFGIGIFVDCGTDIEGDNPSYISCLYNGSGTNWNYIGTDEIDIVDARIVTFNENITFIANVEISSIEEYIADNFDTLEDYESLRRYYCYTLQDLAPLFEEVTE